MKRQTWYSLVLLSVLIHPLYAEETELLSDEKKALIEQERSRYESEHEKLRTNWIAPLNLSGSYSYDKSAATDTRSDLKKASASISQDIFRSGGITYQIDYADANAKTQSLALKQQIATLNEQLFSALLNYRKNRYALSQSDLKLANYDITIFIKRQLYEAGKADITELNTALMSKSSELQNNASLHYAIAQQRYEIAKISDIDPDTFPLPEFSLIAQDEYLHNRLDLQYARSQGQTYNYLYDVTRSGYLPSLALNAAVGYQTYDPKNVAGGYSGNYYSTGLSLSIPLTYNASATIQQAKATYLKQNADTADKEREAHASYAQSLELIESYRRTIDITEKNIALYDELIAATKAGVDAGTKTGYDLQTIRNSKQIEEYTIQINELNVQIELARLHFSVNTAKDIR